MKIRSVLANNRKAQVEVVTRKGGEYAFPYAKLDPRPTTKDPLVSISVDKELASEAVTYALKSGREGSVHLDQILEYNQDPSYIAELLTHRLTVEALRRIETAGVSRRALAARLHTSAPQLYRLLDPANAKKSIAQLIALLHLLDCEVELVVKAKSAA